MVRNLALFFIDLFLQALAQFLREEHLEDAEYKWFVWA